MTKPPASHLKPPLAQMQKSSRLQRQISRFKVAATGVTSRICPICGYEGMFEAFGTPPRFDARCGGCGSLERHRLFVLHIQRDGFFAAAHRVLHFAPEVQLSALINALVATYETADLSDRRQTTHQINIEQTDLPSDYYDRVVCNHVLEHVDDAKALAEIFRMLKPGGKAVLTTPIVEGWAKTYENPNVTDPVDRHLHFGQADHLRIYGRDLRDRIRAAGFDLTEVTAVEPDVLTYGLMRGETLFIAMKPE
jgi:SAM-dependent methyltransferase